MAQHERVFILSRKRARELAVGYAENNSNLLMALPIRVALALPARLAFCAVRLIFSNKEMNLD